MQQNSGGDGAVNVARFQIASKVLGRSPVHCSVHMT